jgi:hypothetical protein
MDGPRCTILLETCNGDRTGRVHVCRDDWRTSSSKERPPYKEWIGETKFSLDPKPVLRTRGAIPRPLLALVSASELRRDILTHGQAVKLPLPVYVEEDIMSISFPIVDASRR